MEETKPKYKVGQIVIMKSIKRELPFRITNVKCIEGAWYYQWNRNNFASEGMLRELTAQEKGEANN